MIVKWYYFTVWISWLITQGNSHHEGLGERFQSNESALFQIMKVNLWFFYANTIFILLTI